MPFYIDLAILLTYCGFSNKSKKKCQFERSRKQFFLSTTLKVTKIVRIKTKNALKYWQKKFVISKFHDKTTAF